MHAEGEHAARVEVTRPDQDYEARGIIAKMKAIGHYNVGPLLTVPIYKYLSLDCGKGKPAMLVQLVAGAPMVKDAITGETTLDMDKLKPGDIVVNPGFLYRKRDWTTKLWSDHLLQLKNYTPKVIYKATVDPNDKPIDLGPVRASTLVEQ